MRDQGISNLRFACVVAMLFAHIPFAQGLVVPGPLPAYVSAPSVFSIVNLILIDGFAKVSAPLLGFFAGYFTASGTKPYLHLIAHRLRRLYVPTIVWSLAYFGVVIAVGYATSDRAFVAHKLATVDVNEFLGLGVFPLNYPLHYLVDLFECTLVLPILMGVLNRMGGAVYGVTIGLIFLGLAFADQNHFKSDDILPRPDLFLFFYAGVAARRRLGSELFHILDTLWETRPRLLLVAAIVFVAGALHTSWLSAPGTAVALTSGFLVMTAVRFSGSLLFAAALPWLRAVAQRGFVVEDGVTFRLLCTHAIVFYLLEPVFGWNRTGIDGIPAFFIAPLIALVAAFVSWRAEVQLKRLFLGLKPARSSGIG